MFTIVKNRILQNITIISHAQNTTALQPDVFLTEIHWLLVIKRRQALPSINIGKANCKFHSNYLYLQRQWKYRNSAKSFPRMRKTFRNPCPDDHSKYFSVDC